MSRPEEDDQTMLPSQEDDRMDEDLPQDEEGEGDNVIPRQSDDSSEEEDDDEEEERRIREGFIVDEDEDEEIEDEDDEDARRHKKRRKRRKKHHQRREEEEEGLEEDDLELLEENTGTSFKKSRLTRLVRRGGSESPPAASSSRGRRTVVESSDDDLEDGGLRQDHDIQRIWEDGERDDDDDDADGDIDDFIDYDDDDEVGMPMDEKARERLRKQRRKQQQEARRKARGAFPELAGIDANAWAEIHDVFGDGHEYDWALAGEDEPEYEDEVTKADLNIHDVFEPSQIRDFLLTEDDNLIRAQDTPERMQLATSSLSQSATLSLHQPLTADDLNGAAGWVSQRISTLKTSEFFQPEGKHQQYSGPLILAVTFVLRCLFVDEYEVPYIWAHKRDHLFHFDVNDMGTRIQLLNLAELWKVYVLGQKYRSLVERRQALTVSYNRLRVQDSYYTEEILPAITSVEVVADVTEWLMMKYKDKRQDESSFQFQEDEDGAIKKHKMPSRVSAYEFAKKSIVSKLADAFGIKSHEIILNFMALQQIHFVEDDDLHPLVRAEQFIDPDPMKAQPGEELLRRARMIIATELGKDPLLRKEIRKIYEKEALVSVEPTERGVTKINESHPYFASIPYHVFILDLYLTIRTSQELQIPCI
ncbi:hypothetical protein E1B28_008922 [Marasmius oreades]|uniref:Uncharacterized protein n=1 Tax=Marasmius oreades TaxID=181124 RepID=A0A9P7RZB5_9AGAR|nr:uncharacterized protein E1B28_008922 [Marasmius oreades]KAG7092574.1 hypothetical protein E1B28_008922 [Marasmius oreades]